MRSMRRAARGSRGGRSKPCSTVVHSLGAALDHDDPTVAKLAHVPIAIRARPQGPPPTISTINHHICLWADTRARTLEPSLIFVHLCGQLRQLHSCPHTSVRSTRTQLDVCMDNHPSGGSNLETERAHSDAG